MRLPQYLMSFRFVYRCGQIIGTHQQSCGSDGTLSQIQSANGDDTPTRFECHYISVCVTCAGYCRIVFSVTFCCSKFQRYL